MIIDYQPKGVCSRMMQIEVEDGVVKSAVIRGGCPGNSIAVGRLVAGMKVEEVIEKLEGIPCGMKPTSCADQLARALKANMG